MTREKKGKNASALQSHCTRLKTEMPICTNERLLVLALCLCLPLADACDTTINHKHGLLNHESRFHSRFVMAFALALELTLFHCIVRVASKHSTERMRRGAKCRHSTRATTTAEGR